MCVCVCVCVITHLKFNHKKLRILGVLFISSSSSSCRATVTDFPVRLWPSVSIVHRAPSRSSILHSVSIQSYCRYVLAGRSTLDRPCEK